MFWMMLISNSIETYTHITSHHITSHHITSHHINQHITSHHITSINTSHHITSHQSTHFVINTKQSIQYLSSSFILKMREREREKEENLCYMLNKCDSLCNECIDNWFPWYLFHHKLNNSLLCVSFPNLLSYLNVKKRNCEISEIYFIFCLLWRSPDEPFWTLGNWKYSNTCFWQYITNTWRGWW
jgi:hypothetical protein